MIFNIIIIIGTIISMKLLIIALTGWCKSNVCMSGKTAIITGGNSGIGFQIALGLAARGCRIILADKDDGTASKEKIIKETHNPQVIYKYIDLSCFKSIKEFADDIIKTEKRLDVLINNAGIAATNIVFTEDGLQRTMQVNYFGPFLLTHLLVGILKKSSPSRIIFTTSLSSMLNDLNSENLNPDEKYYKNISISTGIYGNSKFCDMLAAIGFAERLKGTGVTANCFCPGAVNSKIYNSAKKDQGFFLSTTFLDISSLFFGRTTQEGAQTAIYLACANEVEHVTGKFFKDCMKFPIMPLKAYNKKFCNEIWERSEKLVQLKPNEKL